jgi:hypothetical protein
LDLIEHAGRLILTESIDQRFTDEISRSGAQGSVAIGLDHKGADDIADFVTGDIGDLGHRSTDPLHILRTHMAQDFRRLFLTQRQEEDGGPIDPASR